MKKQTLLIFSCALALVVAGCDKDDSKDDSFTSEDESLAGETVTAGDKKSPYVKLFVLNEGSFGQNNSSLDFFRYSDGKYVRNSFSQMNPTISAGLGDVGNDIEIHGGEAWITVNNSGLVEVIDAKNEKHIATIAVPTPRDIAFDDEYAYVTSYAGAYYGGPARKGAVYRIDLTSKAVKDTINVGYQPEGLVLCGGKIYVANSGGLNPGGYENNVSIISQAAFKVTGSISLPTHKNLKSIVSDEDGSLWVSSFGDYYSVHSGLARIRLSDKGNVVTELDDVRIGTNIVYDSADRRVKVIGSEDEWNWEANAVKEYALYSVDVKTLGVTKKDFGNSGFAKIKWPYSLTVDENTADLFIGDAANGKAPGTIWCFASTSSNEYSVKWNATAGLFPGHFAFYRK